MEYFRGKMHAGRSQTRPVCEVADGRPNRPAPSREDIARLAYSYWEARGGRGGSALDDWLRAERDLSGQTG